MFVPEEFAFNDRAEIAASIRQNSLGLLITHTKGTGLLATHLPFLLNTDGHAWTLISHIANENVQTAELLDGMEVLVIFQGLNAYISSSWYSHPNVSTWNYQAVHCHGKFVKQSDTELWNSLRILTETHESGMENPVHLKDLPAELLREYFPLITGFEIQIHKIEAANKLSQNRNAVDHAQIIQNLRKCPMDAANSMADLMDAERHKSY